MADTAVQSTATQTATTTGRGHRRWRRVIKRQSLVTRLWHWITVICLLVLVMSGMQIFNAHPSLYWGEAASFNSQTSTFDNPLLTMTARRGPDGDPQGITRIAGHSFNTTGVLGLSTGGNGQPRQRGFPSWITLPGPQWLAMGRYWHFAAAWVFAPLLFVYLIYSLITPKRRRLLWPTGEQWRGLGRTIADHARFRFHHTADYNGLQKLTYLLVLFVLLPLMVLTGLTMSPTMDAAWPWLLTVFDGRQSARTIHFVCAFSLVGFFLIHILMVLVSGVFNNLRSMITGGYKIDSHESKRVEVQRHG